MNILYLTFHYKPDLGAGSFRNTALVNILKTRLSSDARIDVITTIPHRYHSFQKGVDALEVNDNITINRIELPAHRNGFADQIYSFLPYFLQTLKLTRGKKYDLVFASSSKLFTAFLASIIARYKRVPLYLDIRDIFADSMRDVLKNKFAKASIVPLLHLIERFTIKRADHLNLVSEGFTKYFKRYYNGPCTTFTNGIDDDFLETEIIPDDGNGNNGNGKRKTITYAGNIGEGQGLEKIVPESALKLKEEYYFRIIGDGGARLKLESRLKELNVNNVEIIKPVDRKKLKKYYAESDFLFLHLNDYKAFEKVLPSKIFEYAATHKNMIAGVGGYAREFINENIPDAIVFAPGNVDEFLSKLTDYKNISNKNRTKFISKFKRDKIMSEMADSIINLAYLKAKSKHEYLNIPFSTESS